MRVAVKKKSLLKGSHDKRKVADRGTQRGKEESKKCIDQEQGRSVVTNTASKKKIIRENK